MYKEWMVLVLHDLIIESLKTWSYDLCWSWRGVEGAASWIYLSRPKTVNIYQHMPLHVQNGHINNCFNISQDSRQCFDYCLVFSTSIGGFLHLASSMQLDVVVLVDALGPELVLEFSPVESGPSQLDLQSAPLGLQLVFAQVHVESVVVQLESALVHLSIKTI
ncbi:hypothetical protein Tco_0969893 [Tanacetum coccineum]